MRVSRNQVTLLSMAVAGVFVSTAQAFIKVPVAPQEMRMQPGVVSQTNVHQIHAVDKATEQTILITARPAFLINADLRVAKVRKAPNAYNKAKFKAKFGSGHNLDPVATKQYAARWANNRSSKWRDMNTSADT